MICKHELFISCIYKYGCITSTLIHLRFDIIKKLGQGTYGKVQLGINKETSQEVAIKTIKKCKIETEADLVRIRREIQIMSSVQHPNIIHIYEGINLIFLLCCNLLNVFCFEYFSF